MHGAPTMLPISDCVQTQAAAGDPWILQSGNVWQLLSTAIAVAAEGSQSPPDLLPRLLQATQTLSKRCEAHWRRPRLML